MKEPEERFCISGQIYEQPTDFFSPLKTWSVLIELRKRFDI